MDVIIAFVALLFFTPFLLILMMIAGMDTNSSGLFVQRRVGQYGKIFKVYKLRTMHKSSENISSIGAWLRSTKIDELPQLVNILNGTMSFVGPRPDLPGYYDKLEGADRKLLELKPGLTSLAALKFYNEEKLLSSANNPKQYNDTVIFPEKVRLNLEYYENKSLWLDFKILLLTLRRILLNS